MKAKMPAPTLKKTKLPSCKKCSSTLLVKAGFINGNQRYKCKDCGCQFQPNRRKGKLESAKRLAVLLYLLGLSMRTISRIVKTDLHAVYRWIRAFAEEHYEKPEPTSGKVIVELDEMWHYINSKKTNSGYGRLIAAIPVNLSTGSVEGETMLHLQNFTND
jgi:transposase-like protein